MIIESTALPEIIALMKDENWEVRLTATNAISRLVRHGMNILWTSTTTD